jgi:hypothetical protein
VELVVIHSGGVPLPETSLIASLQGLKTVFHLTGSRYIGGWHDGSDWDFMTAHSHYIDTLLSAIGFKESKAFKEHQGEYWDESSPSSDGFTNMVWELIEDSVKYQVQVVSNLDAKLYARDRIKDDLFTVHYVSGTAVRIQLWNKLCNEFVGLGAVKPVAATTLEFGSPEYMKLLFQ